MPAFRSPDTSGARATVPCADVPSLFRYRRQTPSTKFERSCSARQSHASVLRRIELTEMSAAFQATMLSERSPRTFGETLISAEGAVALSHSKGWAQAMAQPSQRQTGSFTYPADGNRYRETTPISDSGCRLTQVIDIFFSIL